MAAGVLLVLAVDFVFESTEETEIRFVFAKVQRPLWVALAVTMVIVNAGRIPAGPQP